MPRFQQPQDLCLHGKRDFAGRIKLRVWSWRDYPGLSRWVQGNHIVFLKSQGGQNLRGQSDVTTGATEVVNKQGMMAASKSRKRQGPRASRGTSTAHMSFVCLFVCLFRATPVAYGSSQARDLLVYTRATAMPDPSRIWDLHHSSWQCWILNSLSKARDGTRNLMVPSQIHFRCPTTGTPPYVDFSLLGLILN